MASYKELIDTLRVKVGNPSTAEVDDLVLGRLINNATEEIQDKYKFLKARKVTTFPTVSGSALYMLPSDCVSAFSLWNTSAGNRGKLTKRDENWLSTQQDLQNGPPTDYVRQRGWVQLVPTPDAVYTIRLMYKVSYTKMVDDMDEPVLPLPWHQGIWRLARFLYWDEKGDLAKAQWAQAVWTQWVSDKPNEMEEEDMMDNTEGVILPFLTSSSGLTPSNSQNRWDRE